MKIVPYVDEFPSYGPGVLGTHERINPQKIVEENCARFLDFLEIPQ